MDNQQLFNLTDNQLQVILTSQLGDGCLFKQKKMTNYYYVTNSKNLEYLKFKKKLLETLSSEEIKRIECNGYSQTYIYTLRSKSHVDFSIIKNMSLQSILDNLNNLGIALWIYDDGSLHNSKNYYNLYTNKFSLEEHEEILVPFFKSRGFNPTIRVDKKKDDRIFYYLSFGMYDGAYKINKILQKYKIKDYEYKLWSSETIHKWSKLQEELKRRNNPVLTNRQLGSIMRRIEL